MSGQPLRAAIRAALIRRATLHFGAHDERPLRYVVAFLASGGTVNALAASIGREIGGCSRAYMSRTINRLSAEAKAEIAAARAEGAAYLAKHSLSRIEIDDAATPAVGESDPVALFMPRRGRARFKEDETTLGALHLDALRRAEHRAESAREHVTAGG